MRNTRDRMESKKTLKEVLDFYYDALLSRQGKEIASKLKKANINCFEDYEEEIRKRFVLYNPS